MDVDFIEGLIAVVARSPIDAIEVVRDGSRVRIAKSTAAAGRERSPAEPSPLPPEAAAAAAATQPVRDTAPGRFAVRSPMTGVFYRSAAEGEPPLVNVGDVVEEGQTLGVLEAMKTFNPLEADRAGRIVEAALRDAGPVSVGDVLFMLEAAG